VSPRKTPLIIAEWLYSHPRRGLFLCASGAPPHPCCSSCRCQPADKPAARVNQCSNTAMNSQLPRSRRSIAQLSLRDSVSKESGYLRATATSTFAIQQHRKCKAADQVDEKQPDNRSAPQVAAI